MIFYGKPKIITIEKRQAEYLRCDVCNKKMKYTYYAVMTGHHDWGNDSVDSIEHQEICEKCINDFVVNYLNENTELDSNYINIEKEYFSSSYFGDYDKYENKLVENDEYDIKG